MAYVYELPEVGEGVVEAEIAEWKVAIGDAVAVDQPLCEITTDKASLEISSPVAGTVTRLHGEPGDIVGVHTPLVEFDTEGAPAPAPPSEASAPDRSAPAPSAPAPSAPAPAPAPGPASDPARRGTTKAAPAVRRRARELDIDVHDVPGTGPGGRVTHDDLQAYGSGGADAPLPLTPRALPQVHVGATPEDQRIKIIGVRRKIAARLQAAKRTAPHFTYVEEVDCTKLVDIRNRLKVRAAAQGIKLSFLPFFAKACSVAFRDFPNVNAVMDEEAQELIVKGTHHMGFACDTPNGLMVPVVRDVQAKSILRIAAEMTDLFERTRAGQASRDELMGSSFTITGVGNIGGVLATPILNVPEVGILGINQIKKRPVVDEHDQIVVRQTTFLSPSFDHRIIDGAVGARFTARLKELLEEPESLLLELA